MPLKEQSLAPTIQPPQISLLITARPVYIPSKSSSSGLTLHSFNIYPNTHTRYFSPSARQSLACPLAKILRALWNNLAAHLETLPALGNPLKWFGYDLQEIGGKCSIAVCLLVSIYSIYAITAWCIRLVLFKDASIKMCALLCRITFPDFFLIANSGNQEKA
jgi:hypothetical protein